MSSLSPANRPGCSRVSRGHHAQGRVAQVAELGAQAGRHALNVEAQNAQVPRRAPRQVCSGLLAADKQAQLMGGSLTLPFRTPRC
jgi:hypothetical protein